ncbi:hypothetical protein OLP55_07355 [Campylobacter jejuni]|nr:hypothetical protein [Campylobacter jejuni]
MDFLIAPNSVLNQNKGFSTSSISLQETSAVDGFNKNMAYFSNLFLANEKFINIYKF